MENTEVSKQNPKQAPKLRVVAKKLAKKPASDRMAKYRRLRQLVYKKYNNGHDSGRLPTDPTEALEQRFRRLSVYPEGHPKHAEINLQTTLRIANDCYTFAGFDFDKMDLYEHMEFFLNNLKKKGWLHGEVPAVQVSRALVLAAQHQKALAEKDFGAFVAKQAALANLPESLEASFKTCKNCGDQFRFQAPPQPTNQYYGYGHSHHQPLEHHGECRYHPGAVRCWNDELFGPGKPLREHFLTMGDVRMREFAFMIRACYWDCCGAKLVMPDPDVAKCGKRKQKKEIDLLPWEKIRPDDGNEGCTVLDRHYSSN